MRKAMLHVLMQAYLDHAESNVSCATAGTLVPQKLGCGNYARTFL
jgi:hypothetical protein